MKVEGSIVSNVPTKFEPLPNGTLDRSKIIKYGLELTKLQPPKVERVKNLKNRTTKHYKASSQTPKNFRVNSSVAIRVPR
jgi:hypothetical protein